ncbi:MAG: hypothetical protein COA43_08150 [Robiginitomaculum sp.]|nr:MAG: hypothetical protein COA43_08150 [Robiginitomaculum sp.]
MSVTKTDFFAGMQNLCGSVTLITTHFENRHIGLTATAVCSLCAEPARLLVCINRKGVSYEAIQKSRVFGVNVLEARHADLAKRFAGMVDIQDEDRFAVGNWVQSATGAPLLDDALVSFDCEIESVIETGTHGILIGNIKSVSVTDGNPLLYLNGGFMTNKLIPV